MHRRILLTVIFVLVADAADDLLEQIFDGDQAGHATIFVDHNAHVLFLPLHLAQKLVDPLGFREQRPRPLDAGHRLRARGSIGNLQQIVREGNAGNVIERAAKDRDTRIRALFSSEMNSSSVMSAGNREEVRGAAS